MIMGAFDGYKTDRITQIPRTHKHAVEEIGVLNPDYENKEHGLRAHVLEWWPVEL